jgi:integrase
MGNVRKRGRRWRAEAEALGERKSRSFATKAEAVAWMVDAERRIRAGEGFAIHGRTVRDLLERYADEESPKKAKGAWERTRLAFLCRAEDPLGSTPLARLTPEVMQAWQDRQLGRVSGETVLRDRALLSAAFRHAARVWRWLPGSPLTAVRGPRGNPPRARVCTPEELARLWLVAGTDLERGQARAVAAFELAIETGMRGAEMSALRREDVHLARSFVHLPRTKNGDARDVALSPRAKALLAEVMALGLDPVFGLSAASKDALFRRVRARAGIEGLTFHDSRHTACTRIARKLHVLELARQLGTRDLKTLLIYYNESATELAKRLE